MTFSVAKELLRLGHNVAVFTGFPARTQLDDADRFDEYDLEGLRVFRFHHAYVPMGDQDVVTEIEYDNHLGAQHFAWIIAEFKPDIVHFFHLSRLGAGLIDVVVTARIPAYYTPTDFWSICPTAQLLLHGGKLCAGPTRFAGNCVMHVAELTRGPRARQITRMVPDAVADMAVALTKKGILPPYPLSREVAALARRKGLLVSRLNWLHGIISPTQLMTRVLGENGVDRRLIVNSGYGIDAGGYDAAVPELKADEPLTIGFIGTLAPHKGCHVLIEAFKHLSPGTARLKIYGNSADFPDYYAGLQQQATKTDGVEFCGTFPNGMIGEILAGLHVLVVPSLWYENTPLVVYSALAARRPVIASDFPGLSETIKDGWNGLMFAPGDFKALKGRLQQLVDGPALLAELGRNCRPPKSSTAYVDELLALYKNGLPGGLPAQTHSGLRTFHALEGRDKRGSLAGWAIAGLAPPARITIQTGADVHGQTSRFLPRPDVRDALRKNGVSLRENAFGYVIKLPDGIDRRRASLQCESADGRMIILPLADIACGTSVHLGGGDYMAIDSERLMWQGENT